MKSFILLYRYNKTVVGQWSFRDSLFFRLKGIFSLDFWGPLQRFIYTENSVETYMYVCSEQIQRNMVIHGYLVTDLSIHYPIFCQFISQTHELEKVIFSIFFKENLQLNILLKVLTTLEISLEHYHHCS